MDKTETIGQWNDKKALLKLKFAVLLDGDHLFDHGKKEEIIEKLQLKLGKTREEILKIIDGL